MVNRYDTEDVVDQTILGDEIKLPFSGRVAKSRFMKGAMTERLSSWDQKDPTKRGTPSQGLINLYKAWGEDDYGIILSGNLLVNPVDLEAPGNPVISKDSMSEEKRQAFRDMATQAKAHGSLFIAQLSHAGRQVAEFIQPHPFSASDVKLEDRMGMSFGKPEAMTEEKIKQTVDEFAFAAEECYKAGFDGIQLHGAHGYLIAQFLATTTNKRTDRYGGDLANRSRIIFEMLDEIKRRVDDPKFVLGIKLNSVEFQKGGFDTEECAELCRNLEGAGLDFVELSGGTYEELAFAKRDSTEKREAFFLKFAEVIRPALTRTKVYVTGGFRTGKAMVEAIGSQATDGIGLARPTTAELTLCRDLIANKIHACSKPALDEGDFGATSNLSGAQMGQIARGEDILDASDKAAADNFLAKVAEFMKKTGDDIKSGVVYAGHPVIKV
ncbi:NADH oxidase [Taphrina deformans PYCC 5710]|uniref:NADH oxidase n=1 Tax=Taphrina deformans (strain PYCC 5710 / ATCC 11124 / CBS 356.35 / IMI 108563 / JCM 9778 / NBRC 8474) TaxID=1097556 RepID=R4XHX4_TAPDE|nr:NADH oxidase [Taphrina deformans PYCC 5710]|eukprot:CCG83007.1 NADH oxidase [Taphrina deformans PYCC 5710]